MRLSFINLCLCWHVECAHIRMCCIRLSVFKIHVLFSFHCFNIVNSVCCSFAKLFLVVCSILFAFVFLISWSFWYYQMFRYPNRYLRIFAPLIIIHDFRIDSIHLLWFFFFFFFSVSSLTRDMPHFTYHLFFRPPIRCERVCKEESKRATATTTTKYVDKKRFRTP